MPHDIVSLMDSRRSKKSFLPSAATEGSSGGTGSGGRPSGVVRSLSARTSVRRGSMVASKTNNAAAVTAATDAGLICKIALLFLEQERFHVADYSIRIEIPCRVDLPYPAVWI